MGGPEPGLFQGLKPRSVPYIARVRKNEVLDRMAEAYLTQLARRVATEPSRVWFHGMSMEPDRSHHGLPNPATQPSLRNTLKA